MSQNEELEKIVAEKEKEFENIIGMEIEEAEKFLESNKMWMRIVSVDGKGKNITLDFSLSRINVAIKNNRIVSYSIY